MLHFMTYEFRYEFMYMKNIVKSERKNATVEMWVPFPVWIRVSVTQALGDNIHVFRILISQNLLLNFF